MRHLALLLAASALLGVSTVHAETAAVMASACRPVAAARVVNENLIEFAPTVETGQCWGAFAVLQQITRYEERPGVPFFKICAPPRSSRHQMVSVFVEYVTRNPQRMHEEFFDVATAALSAAFPCQK